MEFYFRSADNRIEGVARSVEDLSRIAERLDPESLSYHLRNAHNDFETWVRDVFADHTLADRIREIKDLNDSPVDIKKNLLSVFNRPGQSSSRTSEGMDAPLDRRISL